MKNGKLKIREMKPTFPNTDRSWLFIQHDGVGESNYDFRWCIGYRKRGKWWGVISMFPATHENEIDEIAREMSFAKEALRILKKNL